MGEGVLEAGGGYTEIELVLAVETEAVAVTLSPSLLASPPLGFGVGSGGEISGGVAPLDETKDAVADNPGVCCLAVCRRGLNLPPYRGVEADFEYICRRALAMQEGVPILHTIVIGRNGFFFQIMSFFFA